MAVGILAVLEAKDGKGAELEAFLVKGREGVAAERKPSPGTPSRSMRAPSACSTPSRARRVAKSI
jgi:hypothetical protein